MLNLFKNLKELVLKPKVYAVVFRDTMNLDDLVVWQVGAYTLEEAISKSKHEIQMSLPESEFKKRNYKMLMWASESPADLMKNFVVSETDALLPLREKLEERLGLKKGMFSMGKVKADDTPDPDGESVNAMLMKKIIDEKNLDLFEKSKHILTETEVKYVKNKIK